MFKGQKFIYTGKNNEHHQNGQTYRIIETGEHWIKGAGFTIWMTTDTYPETNDPDYGCNMDMPYFKTWFWKV